MDCAAVRELVEEFAIGALSPDEAAQVEEHARVCPSCRALADGCLSLTSFLPIALAAASSRVPPEALKSALLRQLSRSDVARTDTAERTRNGQSNPEMKAQPSENGIASGDRSAAAQAGGPSRDRNRVSRIALWPWQWRPRTLTLAVALLLVVGSLTWSVRLSVALAQEQVLRAEFASLVSQQQIVLDVVDSPKTVKVRLAPTANNAPAYGKLYTRTDLPYVVVMAAKLPLPSDGQAYHLWLTDDAGTRLAGVLEVNAQGFGLLVYKADRDGPTYRSASLTLQPTGTKTPNGQPIIAWAQAP